ncbi:related to aminopeptidase [Serendipita indica DSM 11827]|uniref:Peptide hydrolase n=1 Tax=Serendipita indica (strain DSM 11827) TaxID=1109443 RepID=G4THF2_SERID|nr:related to aminopeptidase [Serendipita indica DSM 11827]
MVALASLLSIVVFVVSPYIVQGTTIRALNPDNARLLRFSATHTEWISNTALEYLLEQRHQYLPGSRETVGFVHTSSVNVDGLRNANKALLDGISDEAIRALAGREGFKVGYIDITETYDGTTNHDEAKTNEASRAALPYSAVDPTAHPDYKALAAMVSAQELRNIVGNLSTTFPTRYYRSTNARAPSLWIQSYMSKFTNVSATLFENTFNQPNVISTLTPPGTSNTTPIILLGGHLDSTSQSPSTKAPGADDDASGTAVALHVLSILAKSGWAYTKSKYPIVTHAYAGEEGGLLGSAALAKSYKSAGRSIRGMLNLEMVGWQPETTGSSTITVLTDPNADMSNYMLNVIKAYVPTASVRSTKCGYGCSDHYSFSDAGYPVVCIASYGPNDANLNPNYHRTSDTLDKLNFDRMADFARATLAWIVQVAS